MPHQLDEIYYPSTDPEPVGRSDVHMQLFGDMLMSLRHHYAREAGVYVAGSMFLYYRQGHPEARLTPDLMVIKGVDKDRLGDKFPLSRDAESSERSARRDNPPLWGSGALRSEDSASRLNGDVIPRSILRAEAQARQAEEQRRRAEETAKLAEDRLRVAELQRERERQQGEQDRVELARLRALLGQVPPPEGGP